ncbi:hypothetical protein K435DRAFT_971644, partial [Dendrothele bispora CBS 962.96]
MCAQREGMPGTLSKALGPRVGLETRIMPGAGSESQTSQHLPFSVDLTIPLAEGILTRRDDHWKDFRSTYWGQPEEKNELKDHTYSPIAGVRLSRNRHCGRT